MILKCKKCKNDKLGLFSKKVLEMERDNCSALMAACALDVSLNAVNNIIENYGKLRKLLLVSRLVAFIGF